MDYPIKISIHQQGNLSNIFTICNQHGVVGYRKHGSAAGARTIIHDAPTEEQAVQTVVTTILDQVFPESTSATRQKAGETVWHHIRFQKANYLIIVHTPAGEIMVAQRHFSGVHDAACTGTP